VTSIGIPDDFPLSELLREAVTRWPLPARDAWIADLPRIVASLAERWELSVGPPFQPGGMCAWVAPARDAHGREVVLKVSYAYDESLHEADGLRAWAGDGVVGLYESSAFDTTIAMLLERCVPGTRLRDGVPDQEEQDRVIAGLLTRLWRAPTDGGFRPLTQMCEAWADEFDAKLAAGRTTPVDAGLAREAMALFRELPTTATRTVLLCTDLHFENILAAEREPWLVVDPKPYLGDPTYDVLQHMINHRDRLGADPVGLAERLAGLLDLDRERLLRWMLGRFVQESIDEPWLGEVAHRLRHVVG
jgi:streptomycin 6-kinase